MALWDDVVLSQAPAGAVEVYRPNGECLGGVERVETKARSGFSDVVRVRWVYWTGDRVDLGSRPAKSEAVIELLRVLGVDV